MKIRNLIVASAAILMVPALAIAEPPPGKGNDKESQPQVLVVRDANGALVGQMLSVEPLVPLYNLWIAFRGDPAQAAYFETNPLVVLTAKVGGEDAGLIIKGETAGSRVFFTGAGCTGTPYISVHPTYGVPRVFNLPMLPAEETALGQVLYVPVDLAEVPTSVTVFSELVSLNQQCYDLVDQGLPAPETFDNLTEATQVFLNFQPPYAIGY